MLYELLLQKRGFSKLFQSAFKGIKFVISLLEEIREKYI